MTRWWLLAGLAFVLACGGLRGGKNRPARIPEETLTSEEWTTPQGPAAPPVSTATADPSQGLAEPTATPVDFTALDFAARNRLYLQWVEEKRAAGFDTAPAEDLYLRSLEASLAGDTAQADQYLIEALQWLWALGR